MSNCIIVPVMTKFSIVVDSREIKPLNFINHERKKLDIGDYSISSRESEIAIERKSLQDWINSISGNERQKMERKIQRALSSLKSYYILIECSLSDLNDSNNWFGNMKPANIKGSSLKWLEKFPGLKIMFVDNKQECAETVKSIFEGFLYYNKPEIA